MRWAERLLSNGVNSDDVAVLAGFGLAEYPDSQEIEGGFKKSLDDLGLRLPPHDQALLSYSRRICRNIVDADITPEDGLQLPEPFYRPIQYARSIFMIRGKLAEDVSILGEGEHPIFNIGLDNAIMPPFICDVESQYLLLSNLEAPDQFFDHYACSVCGFIGEYDSQRLEQP